ncbi:DUF5344 family protein [Bacillus sp. T33-2]|uniref:DUF5344 family protein n=1 Tax=Bacillus sp. T33-2 TaxID=2054168 RepID=UPI000C783302|nr:DUF5344 family protein [Bacillus sp. T33-2]PLR95915.1 hypothetical protein CVD19_12895 [Bacillus sp. T33-2]
MAEIKMEYREIEASLAAMKDTCGSLQPQAPQPISGNELQCAEKLADIAIRLQALLTRYQAVLTQNISSAENSVEYMRQTDVQLSGTMNGHVRIQ